MLTVSNDHIKKLKKPLKKVRNRYSLAVKGANDGLWDWDLKANTIFFSMCWKKMLGYDSNFKESPQEWFNLVHPHDLDSLLRMINLHFAQKIKLFNCEYRIRNRMGNYIWVANRGCALWNAKGEAIRFVGLQTDITERKKNEERLIYSAFHDDLTELPNRALFMDRLNQVLLSRSSFAVLYMDIDDFKEVNDTLGHEAGNKLLMIIAKRLENCRRGGDTVARLGGDEFTILLANVR
ncbi:MAG: diguanylate cyclase, partial [Alphaproteobacteria bacterium]|nr:diguanylate cyclase [Alphaproteobacteria bacterium]